ncbi:MAG: hypothetical protein ACRD3E_13605 [Terriglobales bacterium]
MTRPVSSLDEQVRDLKNASMGSHAATRRSIVKVVITEVRGRNGIAFAGAIAPRLVQ